jgi:hypothetical protein
MSTQETADLGAERARVVTYLRSHLIGPVGSEDEVLQDRPEKYYAMGLLYPARTDSVVALEEEPQDADKGGDEENASPDDPVESFRSWMPSSCGLSFFLAGDGAVCCTVTGARYEKDTDKDQDSEGAAKAGHRSKWRRIPFASKEIVLSSKDTDKPVFGGRGLVRSVWRPMGNGQLVTVTLLNAAEAPAESDPKSEECLFQVALRCRPERGTFSEYPRVEHLTRDAEEEELRLVYRHSAVFAVGHNTSVDWERPAPEGGPSHVRTEFMPEVEVPPVSPEARRHHDVLKLVTLADASISAEALEVGLLGFVDDYKSWIDDEQETVPVDAHLAGAKARIIGKQREVLKRMREGVAALSDPQVREAFRLANLAMLVQMRHSKEDLGGASRQRGAKVPGDLDYMALHGYKWRPFQLAYQLMVIPSLADSDADDRETVDLLWFPTGGGKTEAYLGLAAFAIFLRRLRLRDAGVGTVVLTRYTLRLLTTQQFQRSATLICACEAIRRDHEDSLGSKSVTLGLWIGEGGGTPNSHKEASERAAQLLDSNDPRATYCFQLERCPWCGTEIVPREANDDPGFYGVRASNDGLVLYCPSEGCRFHEALPILVVDDDLYASPPAFVISTVDKFARLAWLEKAGALLGSKGTEPPALIIQDELHLLSGPLGTTVGVYEAAVESVIEAHGAPAKIIASTATIRRAGEQITGLYGRDVKLFPPSGIDASDSFFAKVERERTGRLYVGAMTPGHTTAMAVRLTAGPLLAAPLELDLPSAMKDAYWTVVLYHNSLRELGRTMTIARDDVPAHLRLIAKDRGAVREIADEDVVELTGNVGGVELPAILERMAAGPASGDAISVLVCTNMLSVGVDVQRLSVMLVNGQPKTASEYIQATSRVGRGGIPGLILALLSATKPRDRSHYEGFVAFHSAVYRHVEPTSVTPYSLSSRRRALHAALVIAVRHGGGLPGNNDAGDFDPDDARVRRVIEILRKRAQSADRSEAEQTSEALDLLTEEWADRATEARRTGPGLRYSSSSRGMPRLLVDFQSGAEGWETLHSMRNVELQVGVRV